MLIKSHEQLNQAVCETFFSSQLSKMGFFLICKHNFVTIYKKRGVKNDRW